MTEIASFLAMTLRGGNDASFRNDAPMAVIAREERPKRTH
jgi:hypothetical protein